MMRAATRADLSDERLKGLSTSSRLVWWCLCAQPCPVTLSYRQLAALTALHLCTVKAAIRDLERAKLLTVQRRFSLRRGHTANQYTVERAA